MFDNATDAISFIESVDGECDKLSLLRKNLCLDEFGELLLTIPNSRYPRLSQILPRMPSEDVQKLWVDSSGYPLLKQSFLLCVWLRFLIFC